MTTTSYNAREHGRSSGAADYRTDDYRTNDYGTDHYGTDHYSTHDYSTPDHGTQPLPVVDGQHRAPAVPRSRGIDQARYWTGAALGAGIAALAAVTILVLLQILSVSVFGGADLHRMPVSLAGYGLGAAAIALAAAAVYNVMLRIAPRPALYYCWLAVLGTALVTLLPFTSSAPLGTRIGLASVNFIVGLILSFLVPMAAVKAKR